MKKVLELTAVENIFTLVKRTHPARMQSLHKLDPSFLSFALTSNCAHQIRSDASFENSLLLPSLKRMHIMRERGRERERERGRERECNPWGAQKVRNFDGFNFCLVVRTPWCIAIVRAHTHTHTKVHFSQSKVEDRIFPQLKQAPSLLSLPHFWLKGLHAKCSHDYFFFVSFI